MKRILAVGAVLSIGAGALLGAQALGGAADPQVDISGGTKTVQILTLNRAQNIAKGALAECRSRGFAVTVVILDKDGVDLALLRDEDATGATVDTARGKAAASVGFRTPSGALGEAAKANPGLLTVPNFVLLAGG